MMGNWFLEHPWIVVPAVVILAFVVIFTADHFLDIKFTPARISIDEPANAYLDGGAPVFPPCAEMRDSGYWRMEIVQDGYRQMTNCLGGEQSVETPTPVPMN